MSLKTRLSEAVFEAMWTGGWACNIWVRETPNDYILYIAHQDDKRYTRNMGWNRAYLDGATEADLQTDIETAIDDIRA